MCDHIWGTVNDISADNVLEGAAAPLHGPKEPLPKLMLGAIGVVYGDIGTSPLYAMKESFIGRKQVVGGEDVVHRRGCAAEARKDSMWIGLSRRMTSM